MKRSDEMPPALRELGDNLRAAAHREIGPATRRRASLRRAVPAIAVGILALAGVAGAAQLIGFGDPVQPRPELPRERRPGEGAGGLALVANDPRGQAGWGARAYTSRGGESCVLAGQLVRGRLGMLQEGQFRPFVASSIGACGELTERALFVATTFVSEPAPRTLVYGRTRPTIGEVTLGAPGIRRSRPVGRDGVFLFVLGGRVPLDALRVSAG